MDEPTRVLRIVDGDRYEVNDKGYAWKPGDAYRVSPLVYVRTKVNGHAWGPGWRQLLAVAGNSAPAVFGVFIKLLELAANQPRERRWELRDHTGTPGNSREIAGMVGFPGKTVEHAIKVLCDKRLRWIEWVELPGVPGNSRELPAIEEEEKNKKEKNKKEKNDSRKAQSKFVPPAIEEVASYCRERKNGIDPEAFLDFYARQGWKLSNGVAMKDWKAGVRTWEKNARRNDKTADEPKPKILN